MENCCKSQKIAPALQIGRQRRGGGRAGGDLSVTCAGWDESESGGEIESGWFYQSGCGYLPGTVERRGGTLRDNHSNTEFPHYLWSRAVGTSPSHTHTQKEKKGLWGAGGGAETLHNGRAPNVTPVWTLELITGINEIRKCHSCQPLARTTHGVCAQCTFHTVYEMIIYNRIHCS